MATASMRVRWLLNLRVKIVCMDIAIFVTKNCRVIASSIVGDVTKDIASIELIWNMRQDQLWKKSTGYVMRVQIV